MKKHALTKTFYGVILSTLMLLPVTSSAIDLFNTNTGYLVIPELDINGDTFVDDVTLKLDFATGTFEVIGFSPKPETISPIPLDTMEDQDIKMAFMGCARSARNEVTCHLKLTSLGGFDRTISVGATNSRPAVHADPSMLYDNLGTAYEATEVSVANSSSSTNISLNLIAGIPTLVKFKFNDVSPNAVGISLFQPEFRNSNRFSGDFRNINF